jgi:hypothetical protein
MSVISTKADVIESKVFRLALQTDTALFIQLALLKPPHFTGRGLVIMLRGFQTAHLAARPERRNNRSQHFSRWGPGRRVECCDAFSTEGAKCSAALAPASTVSTVPSDANFHAK